MTDWKERLTKQLEPILRLPDPRPKISAYNDMPYAIFRYGPEDEFAVREETRLLTTRLEQVGKRVTTISLAESLSAALAAQEVTTALIESEDPRNPDILLETLNSLLAEIEPLDELVAARMPPGPDPLKDVVFITRAGALFPFYRTSSLLEQLKGKVSVPSILFYPGDLDGAAGLRFMGVLDAEHNYRPKIF
jgi:hypothetical protein